MDFHDKVAVITGGGQGIGKAVSEKLASEGSAVIIGDANRKKAEETGERIRASFQADVSVIETDVRKKSDIQKLIGFADDKFGKIDILFNNAGICTHTKIEDISEEEWNRMLDINLRGVFFCCQAVMPVMKRQRSGRILNMASNSGKSGGIMVGVHYSASKAGVICLTKCFAKALAPYGIRVNTLAPGPVKTAMTQDLPQEVTDTYVSMTPLGRLADPEDIAAAAVFLLSDGAGHITGATLDVNGGLLMD